MLTLLSTLQAQDIPPNVTFSQGDVFTCNENGFIYDSLNSNAQVVGYIEPGKKYVISSSPFRFWADLAVGPRSYNGQIDWFSIGYYDAALNYKSGYFPTQQMSNTEFKWFPIGAMPTISITSLTLTNQTDVTTNDWISLQYLSSSDVPLVSLKTEIALSNLEGDFTVVDAAETNINYSKGVHTILFKIADDTQRNVTLRFRLIHRNTVVAEQIVANAITTKGNVQPPTIPTPPTVPPIEPIYQAPDVSFEILDKNKDLVLNFGEFSLAFAPQSTTTRSISAKFYPLSKNDSEISVQDWLAEIKKAPPLKMILAAQNARVVRNQIAKLLDVNADQAITYPEFSKLFPSKTRSRKVFAAWQKSNASALDTLTLDAFIEAQLPKPLTVYP